MTTTLSTTSEMMPEQRQDHHQQCAVASDTTNAFTESHSEFPFFPDSRLPIQMLTRMAMTFQSTALNA